MEGKALQNEQCQTTVVPKALIAILAEAPTILKHVGARVHNHHFISLEERPQDNKNVEQTDAPEPLAFHCLDTGLQSSYQRRGGAILRIVIYRGPYWGLLFIMETDLAYHRKS